MTSHDVVSRVRRLFGTRQVGHTGTLDPMATGVLILLLGRAAKASSMSHDEKSYEAVLRLGLRTDTEDTTGVILSTAPAVSLPDGAALDAVLPRFRGKICQIPPMYSAPKVGGRKLCDIARAGGTVERQPRPVEIRALTAEPAPLPSDFRLHVTCSGGTYIRTLCADIGDALACGGTMAALRRTAASSYPVSACRTPEELAAMEPAARVACLPAGGDAVLRPAAPVPVGVFIPSCAGAGASCIDATEPASAVSDRSAPAAVRCGRYVLRARRGSQLPGRHGNQNDQAVCPRRHGTRLANIPPYIKRSPGHTMHILCVREVFMLTILLRTLIIYLTLVVTMRVMGKRQLGELEVSELVTTLLLSEVASLPITNQDIPLAFAIVPVRR